MTASIVHPLGSSGRARRPRKARRSGSLVAAIAASVLLLGGATGVARARGKLVDLHGAALVGTTTGGGGGTPDLFDQTEGVGFGAELGVRLLVLDLSIRFTQMLNAGGAGGTMLTALFGPSVEIPVKGGGKDALGKELPPEIVVRPGLAAGLCFGTASPVDPPLTNDQLAGKGLVIMGRFAVERMFGPILGLGGEIEGGYHYVVGPTGVINTKDHSSGWQIGLFGTAAFHLGI